MPPAGIGGGTFKVLASEIDKPDTAIIGLRNEGLVKLTGKQLPPDPKQWNAVVQAGFEIAPEPTWWQNTVEQAVRWVNNLAVSQAGPLGLHRCSLFLLPLPGFAGERDRG